MDTFGTAAQVRAWSKEALDANERIAMVPTMGFLHEGHLSLIKLARKSADRVIASIFVNPTQFGPSEDLERYPRDLARDQEKLRTAGCDALFVPVAEEVYPPGFQSFVAPESLGDTLCGASRPGHFRGVCTIVTILLRIAQPHAIVLGEKDFQQLQILRRMVKDLWLDVDVISAPIIREEDGLAMSSRNAYLSPSERKDAQQIPRALDSVRTACELGECRSASLEELARSILEKTLKVEYVSIVDGTSLQPLDQVENNAVIAIAAVAGTTRLIDNRRLR